MSSISFTHPILIGKWPSSIIFPRLDMKFYCKNLRSEASSFKRFDLYAKMALPFVVACNGKDNDSPLASPDDELTALETVLKMYTAIRNKNINELSDIIGEESWCISNFVSAMQPFYGKKEVLDFFKSVIKFLGDHIELVVQPTLHDGMSVGVSWKLECSKTHISLGKGFSLHTCHSYRGKVIIKNLDMFMEPLLHIEPLRLQIISLLANTTYRISRTLLEKSRATLNILIPLLLVALAALLIFSQHRQYTLRLIARSKP